MPKRRNYSEEFKREAVLLASQSGVTLKQIGEELGINPNIIGRWRREMNGHGERAFPGHGHQKPERAEVAALKREIKKLKAERDILKKAAADSICQSNILYSHHKLEDVRNGTIGSARYDYRSKIRSLAAMAQR